MSFVRFAFVLSLVAAQILVASETDTNAQFQKEIRPALVRLCGECHNKDKEVPFLKATKVEELNSVRWAWRSAVGQLRNRTMPPADETQPTEVERLNIATWLEKTLRETAPSLGEYAGAPVARRLNRLEYDNTIRDLTGLTLHFSETFPTEGSGGEGFSNNGETLFLPPILMERYMDASQQILDSAIITPALNRTFSPSEFASAAGRTETGKLAANDEVAASVGILVNGDYEISLATATGKGQPEAAMLLKLDGIAAHRFKATEAGKPSVAQLHLQRGVHTLSIRCESGSAVLTSAKLVEKQPALTDAKRAAHQRIFGTRNAEAFAAMAPELRKTEAKHILESFMHRAFRRPLRDGELDKFMSLYQRGAERGDAFEESMKLALKAVLVSPYFLFRVEAEHEQAGIHPISDHELASRLSYFLWATMPDDELMKLADEKKLNDPEVLTKQVDRMLADPKSRAFLEDFTGQWLGTKEVGASVAFTQKELKHIYTSELAEDLRGEPVEMMKFTLNENRSLLELINSNFVFVTERTAKHYGLEDVKGPEFRRVLCLDGRRGGVIGLGAVHMITSHPDRTSPVLRGAWVLETMFGVRVPPPPPDVPPLTATSKKLKDSTLRASLEKHRSNPSCAACHNLMDPIGFGMENYDIIGRWRDTEGKLPIDSSGAMPSGEKFNGPRDLKRVLMNRKGEFIRHLCGKMMGYALGRSLDDRDDFTIEKIAATLEADKYRSRTLIREIVLSTPFRNRQDGEAPHKNAQPKKKKDLPAAKPL